MNAKIGDVVIIPGGKAWTGQRGKLVGINADKAICKVDVEGYVIDVFAFDVSLSYGKESGKGQRTA
jgi:hypothetical protein